MAISKTKTDQTETVETTETVVNTTKSTKAQPKRKAQLDLQEQYPVVNMTQAALHYSAKKGTGFLELGAYLDTDYMTLEDLQIMKNTARGMFTKGWLLVDDEEAVEFLGLQKETQAILKADELDDFFQLTTEEIKAKMETFSASTKENIYQALKAKYESQEISNAHTIKAIEASLNIDPTVSVLALN